MEKFYMDEEFKVICGDYLILFELLRFCASTGQFNSELIHNH
jgi:hypothetical protein